MGKKSKKKINNSVKERKDSSNLTSEVVGDGVLEVKGRETCRHIENGIDLNKIKEKFSEKDSVRCEDCRGSALDRKESKGRSKHGKKGTDGVGVRKDTKCVWVCLQCGHFACGGVGMPNNPQSHAIRHSRQLRHPCVIQFENTNLCWCFHCGLLIPVGKSEHDGQENAVLLDAVKLIKRGPREGVTSVDVEDVWFGSGSVGGQTVVTTESLVSGKNDGYVVRGLANLGNTCFFNSVMQNILAMDLVRDYFMKLDQSVGPLTMALKKLFIETSCEASRNGISPRNLFGCICSKAPMFKGYQQQDSHELLRCLLDGLCTEELNLRKTLDSSKSAGTSCSPGSTFVDAIFGGQLSSTVTCTVCRYSSVTYDPFLDLSLPIPKKKSSTKMVPRSRSKKAKLPIKKETKKGAKFRGKGKTDSCIKSCATGSFENKDSSSIASSSVPLQEEKVDLLELTWLDFLDDIEPARTLDTLDSVSENYNISTNQVSESKHSSHDDDMSHNSSEVQSEVFSPNIEPTLNEESSRDNMYENDLPVLQGSEVLLLPYKEENLTTDEVLSKENVASCSVLVAEQDSLDFDGFGDLFNEPEMSSVSNVDDNNSLMITQTASLSGISSESDPDEVDDSDAPVSIKSCLSLYTEPELLSKEEAWNCENCAKIARGEQVCSDEKMPNTTLKKNESQNVPLDGYLLSAAPEPPEPRSLENGYPESDFGLTIERDNDIQSSYTPQEVSVMTDCKSSSQVSFVDQAAVSFHVDGSDCSEVDVNQVLCMASQSTVRVKSRKSNDSDKADGKLDKVPRDATKMILINKAPPILTIHLKRFSQDARGFK
ncbi:hypothetical protein IFM89_028132 [Coptis chinensis]|uniref:Ubiquitinyl hydrolase 1 n=1 Tax=Coptis chinensis TaxID=261450 RepID=A0A835HXX8_9MAGN|nr:hypothetical protein IFM89_028132 [Coptis chinensis]